MSGILLATTNSTFATFTYTGREACGIPYGVTGPMWDWLRRLVFSNEPAEPTKSVEREISNEVRALNAFYYDVAMQKLNSQFRKINAIDTRSTSYFTIGSAILPIVAGFLSSDKGPIIDSAFAKYALFGGFGFYVLLAVFTYGRSSTRAGTLDLKSSNGRR